MSKLQSEISTRKYVNGLSNYSDWDTIENAYMNTQIELLDNKKAAALATAKWHNFIGDDHNPLKKNVKEVLERRYNQALL